MDIAHRDPLGRRPQRRCPGDGWRLHRAAVSVQLSYPCLPKGCRVTLRRQRLPPLVLGGRRSCLLAPALCSPRRCEGRVDSCCLYGALRGGHDRTVPGRASTTRTALGLARLSLSLYWILAFGLWRKNMGRATDSLVHIEFDAHCGL